ncbi:hypothetical protein DM992_07280 [Burkholderia sp. JP2-270]|nr:hypothetical protein DM992_07280 [Burkholderia sp. JP2-270]
MTGKSLSQLRVETSWPANGDPVEYLPQRLSVSVDVMMAYEADKLIPTETAHIDSEDACAFGFHGT